MNSKPEIKLSYVTGLKSVVKNEISKNDIFHIVGEDEGSIYVDFSESAFLESKNLKSVARVYLVLHDKNYNPGYVSKHKSILKSLTDEILNNSREKFKSFKITCAGADSVEVRAVAKYLEDLYKLVEKDEADLKIHIIKLKDFWEVGAQITVRPLSFRDYKDQNMSGAMDPTVAYALNSFCKLEKAESYLNIFSGSATLPIEALKSFPNIKKVIGFDNDKKHLSLSIQNIKKAGFIKKIQIKEADLFLNPDFGMFDVITSDLPFGMKISKGDDLEKLYSHFINYCEKILNKNGILAVYTSEYDLLEKILLKSKFKIQKTLQLKFMTNVGAYLKPKLFVCGIKK